MAFFSWDSFKDLIYETMEYIFRENGREPFFVLCFCYLIEISVCCLKMVALDHWILYLFFFYLLFESREEEISASPPLYD
jgi:hypothetical protein